MKQHYLFLLFVVGLLFISCSRDDDKSSDTEKYYVKFKINDIQKEDYYKTALEDFEQSSIFEEYPKGKYTFQLLDIISVQFNKSDFQPKIYSWNYTNSSNNMNFRWFDYLDPQSGNKFSFPYISGSNMTFNITSVSNNEVRGTFTGKIIASSKKKKKAFNITNGEFYAPIR